VSYRIEVRYDVRRGKPSWDKADFDFSDPTSIDIEATGKGTIDVETEPGTLHLWNVEGNYELKVRGFDPRRDLLLSVSEVERVN
jgi:hypothetical protein